jgi:hypothetical protein
MPEDPHIRLMVALRVLSEINQEHSPPSHMSAVALRGLAETDEERSMTLDTLASAVAARERSRLKDHGGVTKFKTHSAASAA